MAYDNGGMQDVAVTAEEPTYDAGAAAPAASYAPQPAAGAQPAAAAGETGLTPGSLKRVFTSPPGILRAVEFFCAMITFSAIVDASVDGNSDASYSDYSEWEYAVAIGILVWLYSMFMMVAMLFDLYAMIAPLGLIELGADALFAFLMFVAGIAAAARCDTKIGAAGGGLKYCDSDAFGSGPRAGAAFAFLTSFALMGSAFFSLQAHRNK